MNKLARGLFLTVALLLMSLGISYAGVIITPTGIPYSGRLTDAGGAPVNGARDLTLTLYNSGGTVLYSETMSAVTVVNGLFSVEVGTGTPVTGTFSAVNFTTHDVFLGVTVGADPEMAPRIHLGYAPFSLDSPGIASSHPRSGLFGTYTVNFPATVGTPIDIVSVTVFAPTAGYVFVIAGGQINTGAAGYNSIWLSETAGSTLDGGDYGYVGVPSAAGYFQATRQKVFAAAPGSHTYYFAGQIQSGAAGSYVWEPTISAIFIPASVGTIALAPTVAMTPAQSQQAQQQNK